MSGSKFNGQSDLPHALPPDLLSAIHDDNVNICAIHTASLDLTELAGRELVHQVLSQCAAAGSVKIVKHLLDIGADPTWCPDRRFRCPQSILLRAVKHQQQKVIQRLLDWQHQRSPSAIERDALEGLLLAVHARDVLTVKRLEEAGIDLSMNLFGQCSILHLLACDEEGEVGPELATYLLQQADVHGSDEHGRLPIHYCCLTGKANLARAMMTIDHSISNKKDNTFGDTPLSLIVAANDLAMFEQLEDELDINTRDNDEWSALHHAASRGHSEMAKKLLAAGCKPTARNSFWRTPLHLAAEAGHLDVVRILVGSAIHYSPLHLRDKGGKSAEDLARIHKHDRCAELVKKISPRKGKHNIDVKDGDRGVIVNFIDRKVVQHSSVRDMLWSEALQSKAKEPRTDYVPPSEREFRWCHLPLRNVLWVTVLEARHLIETQSFTVDDAFAKAEADVKVMPNLHSTASSGSAGLAFCSLPTIGLQQEYEAAPEKMLGKHIPLIIPPHLKPSHISSNQHYNINQFWKFTTHNGRRTLHQHFTDKNAYKGGQDERQVLYRHSKERQELATLIMVDRLHMWVFPCGLVVTAMSPWAATPAAPSSALYQPEDNHADVLGEMVRSVLRYDSRPDKHKSHQVLVDTLLRACFNFKRLKAYTDTSILSAFRSSLQGIGNVEMLLSLDAKDALAEVSKGLSHTDGQPVSHYNDCLDRLFNVITELSLLDEIDSILYDCKAIRSVLDNQRETLARLKMHRDLVSQIENDAAEFDAISMEAQRLRKPVETLLEQKQRFATSIEARLAREQAVGTASQGETILVLTIVTIIFLPMTFIASFFTMPMITLPQVDGDIKLPPQYVLRYVLGIGTAVALPLVVFAIQFPKMTNLWRMLVRPVQMRKPALEMLQRLRQAKISQATLGYPGPTSHAPAPAMQPTSTLKKPANRAAAFNGNTRLTSVPTKKNKQTKTRKYGLRLPNRNTMHSLHTWLRKPKPQSQPSAQGAELNNLDSQV